jgi:hypothetical protein
MMVVEVESMIIRIIIGKGKAGEVWICRKRGCEEEEEEEEAVVIGMRRGRRIHGQVHLLWKKKKKKKKKKRSCHCHIQK